MRLCIVGSILLLGITACAGSRIAVKQSSDPYRLLQRFSLGGTGGWDLLALDPERRRVFISRSDRVMVMDADTGKMLGEIPATQGVHGIALASDLKRGYTSNGRSGTVTVFDLDSLAVLDEIPVTGKNPDVILYDMASHHVFSFNPGSTNATVIDAATLKVVATLALPGQPELAVSDGHGRVYVNLEDKGQIAVIDSRINQVLTTWSLAPCEAPTGLALDADHGRLFSVCANRKMMVLDAQSGRQIAELPIGDGPDGAEFDPATQLAFSSNRDGTLTIVHEDDPNHFTVIDTIPTQKSARTMVLDPVSHRIYLPAAEFGPRPEPTAEQLQPRPPVLPGTFSILVVGQ